MAGFVALSALASAEPLARRRGPTGPMQLLLVGTAAYRIGRMLAFERVATPLRGPFTATVPDASGAGETVVARGRGPQWVIGELLSCPICVATWASAGLFAGLGVLPRFTRGLIAILAATGVAEILHGVVETLTWSSERARVQAAPDQAVVGASVSQRSNDSNSASEKGLVSSRK